MASKNKKRRLTARERIDAHVQALSELHAKWLDKAREATDFPTKAEARHEADVVQSKINDLYRKRRAMDKHRRRQEQPKLF
jgi:hypothetical protein